MSASADPRSSLVHRVLARSATADDRTRSLKHDDAFAVFDHRGDIVPAGLGEHGLYAGGTRFLSTWVLDLDGALPFFLGATIRDEGDPLVARFTNPDLEGRDGAIATPLGTIHVEVRKFLWRNVLYQQISVTSFAAEPLDAELTLHFAADFADIFEVRGARRRLRGAALEPVVRRDSVTLGYRGLDGVERRTELCFAPAPDALDAESARYRLRLEPGWERRLDTSIACRRSDDAERVEAIAPDEAHARAKSDLQRYRAKPGRIWSSSERVNAWLERAIADLHMLTTELDTGPYPYAGIPWFNTPFGRDGLVTALLCGWARPDLGRGVLRYLAATQARELSPADDAEPGKILHETRTGELAATREIPFGRYYGSVDATPLFVTLAHEHYRRTGDLELARELWPHVQAALEWIERHGDRDGDGFVEYERRAPTGLLHQGWKDSDDAIMHADGSPAEGPIALCEVQGYVFGAWRAGAALAAALGMPGRARELERRATDLAAHFDAAFWCPELGTYALALDGDKRPCRVKSSNAGQCLFGGIARASRARALARTLVAPDSFSGWGVRTLAAGERRFNPMGYHTGAVWPHDNALIARGLRLYGHRAEALKIFAGLFEAGTNFELSRVPELFCGFDRVAGEGPVMHPVACAPQAWAAGSVLALLQTSLGLDIDALAERVALTRPCLPVGLKELWIHDLEVGSSVLDLAILQERDDVTVKVVRREGEAQVVVVE